MGCNPRVTRASFPVLTGRSRYHRYRYQPLPAPWRQLCYRHQPSPATAKDPAAVTATFTATMAGQPMPAAGPATATSRYQPLLLLSATVTAVTPTLLLTASTRHSPSHKRMQQPHSKWNY
jgi:hypothetical protein